MPNSSKGTRQAFMEADVIPFPLICDVDDEQDLQKMLKDFDPSFDLFSSALAIKPPSLAFSEEAASSSPPSKKRRVQFDLEDGESVPKKQMSPLSDDDQRQARNELWKKSLKRSMFFKQAS